MLLGALSAGRQQICHVVQRCPTTMGSLKTDFARVFIDLFNLCNRLLNHNESMEAGNQKFYQVDRHLKP